MNKIRFALVFTIVLSFVVMSLQAQEAPDTITINYENLLPEGIEWDAIHQQFLVSSQMFGTIHAVADDGTLTAFIEDDELGFTNGIHIDTERNRLLVTTTDTEAILDCEAVREEKPFTGLAIYNLETGERINLVDLSDLYPNFGSFTNDVTVDAEGNAYVTDWCGGGIYKVDLDGNTSTLFTSEALYVVAPGLGAGALNGIDYHPDNYLLVSGGFGTTLYKVTLESPISITPVVLDIPAFADGVTILENGDAVLIGAMFSAESEVGFFNATMRYTSEDNWQSATLKDSMIYDRFATTGVTRDGEFYSILSGVVEPLPVSSYEIIRIDFDGSHSGD